MNTTDEARRLREQNDADKTANDLGIDETVEAAETDENAETEAVTLKQRIKHRFPRLYERLERIGVRPIVAAASVLVIGVAVWLNFMLFSPDAQTAEDTAEYDLDYNGSELLGRSVYVGNEEQEEEDSYFAMSQLSRQRARDEALEVIRMVIEDENAVKDVKDKAHADADRIAAEIADEANIETLIMAKGFEDCVAVVSSDIASIIVKSDGLLVNEVAQIKEIVWEQTGIEPTNIKIIEKN